MNIKPYFIALLCLLITLGSCRKEIKPVPDCFPNDPAVRQIKDQKATIKLVSSTFYIIEKAMIDTKLMPCNLSKDFQVDDLDVIVSGDVKATLSTDFGPCCTENFVITKISK